MVDPGVDAGIDAGVDAGAELKFESKDKSKFFDTGKNKLKEGCELDPKIEDSKLLIAEETNQIPLVALEHPTFSFSPPRSLNSKMA